MVAPMSRRSAGQVDAAGTSRRGSSAWLTSAAVARAARGEVLTRGVVAARGAACTTIATDTRGDCSGRLFVALRGERHDAHDHLLAAVRAGATGLLVDRAMADLPAELLTAGERGKAPYVVRVADTGRALLDLAAEHRRRQRARVIGITGSCGKTSTKEWLGATLAAAMPTVRSPGSFNNQVGVPLTLFSIGPDTRAAVVEIGTNRPGEIAELCEVVQPEVGIVTCVALAHLAGLGSLEGVAAEKASLPKSLPAHGLCVLNGDDAACRAMAAKTSAQVQFTSVHEEADWFATDVRFHALGTSFLLRGERPVTLPRLGTHNVYNALAVIAAATWLGVPEDQVLQSLSSVPSAARRLEPKVASQITVYDDTYNMNPQSARAALQALAGLPVSGGGRRWVVFGEMRELGEAGPGLHRDLGAQVQRAGLEQLVCVGAGARAIADGALAAGMSAARVSMVDDIDAAHELLAGRLVPGDRVLCKASRGVQLDRLVDRLLADLQAGGASAGRTRAPLDTGGAAGGSTVAETH